jgi:tRNA 2-thiouridine synthesizing protein A
MNHDIEIDTRDQNCPVPILKAYQAIRSLNDNQVLKIVAASSSAKNFTAFAASARNAVLLHNEIANETLTLHIQKGPPACL